MKILWQRKGFKKRGGAIVLYRRTLPECYRLQGAIAYYRN